MARKKFDFNKALKTSGGALAGGVAAATVEKFVSDSFPDMADRAYLGPAILGAFLSQQKDSMIQAVGIGMIGAAGPAVASEIGINGAGVGRRGYNLSPGQKKRALEAMRNAKGIPQKSAVQVAGTEKTMDALAGANQ